MINPRPIHSWGVSKGIGGSRRDKCVRYELVSRVRGACLTLLESCHPVHEEAT